MMKYFCLVGTLLLLTGLYPENFTKTKNIDDSPEFIVSNIMNDVNQFGKGIPAEDDQALILGITT